jgi:hypothetical protein
MPVLHQVLEGVVMEWLRDIWPLATIVPGCIALFGVFAWLARCRHPNPHYQREVVCRDPMTESDEVIEPATYICYECGKTWRVTVRDPAWAPTGIRQRFSGYDPALAARAAKRVEVQRLVDELLVKAPPAAGTAKRRRPLKASAEPNVTDINTRRPA